MNDPWKCQPQKKNHVISSSELTRRGEGRVCLGWGWEETLLPAVSRVTVPTLISRDTPIMLLQEASEYITAGFLGPETQGNNISHYSDRTHQSTSVWPQHGHISHGKIHEIYITLVSA